MKKSILIFIFSIFIAGNCLSQAKKPITNVGVKSSSSQLKPKGINVKNTQLEKEDSIKEATKLSITKTAAAINYSLLKLAADQLIIDSHNGKRIYKEFVVNSEHPLKVHFSIEIPGFLDAKEQDGHWAQKGAPGSARSIQLIDLINDITILGNLKMLVGPVIKYQMVGGQVKFVSNDTDYSDCLVTIDNYTIPFSGNYLANNIPFEFLNGFIVYKEKGKSGFFLDGTTCMFNGYKFIFSGNEWKLL